MSKAILASAVALCMTLPAAAQTAVSLDNGSRESTAPNYRYASDYQVGSWSIEERARPAPRNPNTLQSNDELLGGPVPEVERQKLSNTGGDAMRVVMTDVARERANVAQAGRLPGRQVEDRFGTPLGRIAVIERDTVGNVSAAWVQPPNAQASALRKIEVQSIAMRAGRVVVETP